MINAADGKPKKNPDCLACKQPGSKQEILNLIFGKPTSLKCEKRCRP